MVRMSSPVKGYVSQNYRARVHAGIDIATGGKSAPVHASFAGTIDRIVTGRPHGNRTTDSYAPDRTGNYIAVRNPDGERQLYNHTAALPGLRRGQSVAVGQQIGVTDLSGNTTGHHLHYEEWTASGATRDPLVSFRAFNVTPGATPVKGSAPTPAVRTTLRRGMHGDDVADLQRALNKYKATPDRRWPNGDLRVDGDYGSYTQARVTDWQQRNHGGLYPRTARVDGVAGPVTLRALDLL